MLYNFCMTRKIDCGEYIHWISDVLEKRTELLLAKGGLTLSQMMVIESFRHSKDGYQTVQDIQNALLSRYEISEEQAREIAYRSQGNYDIAKKIAEKGRLDDDFVELFITGVRNAFQAKKKPIVLREIIHWARGISEWSRDKQKDFLNYCLEMFRLALIQNYGAEGLVYKKLTKNNFNWDAFSTYIQGANIELILDEINSADLHIQRNANSKIVWTDLGIKLIRYIHKGY